MTSSDTMPREQLLLKLLKMTTATNDTEALVAIRKANSLLTAAGWDWDKLIAAKIKIVESPFGKIPVPPTKHSPEARPYVKPQPAAAQPQPAHSPVTLGYRINAYAGWCYCCGEMVHSNKGNVFYPDHFNTSATNKKSVVCRACNDLPATVPTKPAKKKQHTLTLNDLFP